MCYLAPIGVLPMCESYRTSETWSYMVIVYRIPPPIVYLTPIGVLPMCESYRASET
jgi:hypothetical protein